jgi:hypothetical protein
MVRFLALVAGGFLFAYLLIPSPVLAHCDTYGGPVVTEAKKALEKGDVTPLLKWVKKTDEEQIKTSFNKTLAVRTKGPEAKDLAENYFFETLVRLHRACEGEPYTGLKNEPPKGIIALADKALESGISDSLVGRMTAHLKERVNARFSKALSARKNADKSVEAGREFVEAYVEYLHYVEGIRNAVMTEPGQQSCPKEQKACKE